MIVLHVPPSEIPEEPCEIHATCRSTLVPILRLATGMRDLDERVSSKHRIFFHGTELRLDGTMTGQEVYDLAVQALPLDTLQIADDTYDLSLVRVHKLPLGDEVVSCDSTFDAVGDQGVVPFVHFVRWFMGKTLVRASGLEPDCTVPPFEPEDRPVFLCGGGQNAIQTFGAYAAYAKSTGHLDQKRSLAGASMGAVIAASYVSAGDTGVVYDRFVRCLEEIAGHRAEKSTLERALRVLLADKSHETFEDLFLRRGQRLDVVVTDVKSCKPCVYNWITTPRVPILDAVLASCSIPFVLGVHEIDRKLLCDGEIYAYRYLSSSNVPFVVIDYIPKQSAIRNALEGLRFASGPFASVMCAVKQLVENYSSSRYSYGSNVVIRVPMDDVLFMELSADFAGVAHHIQSYNHGYSWVLENV
jgi:hypothetical protein